ncbi:MAG: outer membrane beta-barrel protein [Candidatus Cloacimonetes bacterium]|nr:outer membrane beta-barrel protein [Candidatus Cloacimonadota bacterium]
MKKSLFLIAVLAVALTTLTAQKIDFGGNLELAVPMGDFGDLANIGFGITAQAEYPVNEQIVATGSLGYLMWSPKDEWKDMDYSWSCIPIKAGAKYLFGDNGLYGILEIGLYMFTVEWEYEYDYDDWDWKNDRATVKGDDSETEFGFAPGIGYQMPINEKFKLDLSLQYEIAGDFDFLGFDIGIRF